MFVVILFLGYNWRCNVVFLFFFSLFSFSYLLKLINMNKNMYK